ncbi:hypothetical protein OROMI_008037 [Orobanche minor]
MGTTSASSPTLTTTLKILRSPDSIKIPNGTNIYDIDLSGKKPLSQYKPLPKPLNNEKYKGKLWRLVKKGANLTDMSVVLGYAITGSISILVM